MLEAVMETEYKCDKSPSFGLFVIDVVVVVVFFLNRIRQKTATETETGKSSKRQYSIKIK